MQPRLHRTPIMLLTALSLVLAACAPAGSPSPAKPADSKPAESKPAAETKSVAAPTTAPAAAQAPTTSGPVVEVAAATVNNMNAVPWFVGVEKGIWLKHGLDVKLKVFQTGPEMGKALQAKDADFTTNAFSNFLPGIDQGLPFIALAISLGDSTVKYSDNQLLIAAGEGTGIKTVEDLAGKKIGLVTSGTTDEYIKAVLAKHNVPLDKVTLLNTPVGNSASVLATKQVDATVTWEPYGSMVLDQVKGSYQVLRGGGYISYNAFLVTRPDMIQDKPEIVQKFVDGWVESAHFTRQKPDEGAEVSTRWISGLDLELAKKAIRLVPQDPRLTSVVFETVEDHNKVLLEQKKIKSPVDIRQVMNTSFIEKTTKQYPQFFADLKPV